MKRVVQPPYWLPKLVGARDLREFWEREEGVLLLHFDRCELFRRDPFCLVAGTNGRRDLPLEPPFPLDFPFDRPLLVPAFDGSWLYWHLSPYTHRPPLNHARQSPFARDDAGVS